LLLRQASFDELALKVREISPEKASVAGNVVAAGPQAGKSFVKHRNDPLSKW
jgi:hypothetical protein